jgi:rhodanese-related sulfurtransferase
MTIDRISPQDAKTLELTGEPVVYVDSRNPKAWAESEEKIPSAIRIPADDVVSRVHDLDRDARIIAYCT